MNSDRQQRISTLAWKILITSSFVLALCTNAFAQVTASGAISGTVKDKNQAAIANATVTITNKSTGRSRTASTNEDGEYKIDLLPAGRYDITSRYYRPIPEFIAGFAVTTAVPAPGQMS